MRAFFAPQVDRVADLQDLVARAAFYLAHLDLESITFVTEAQRPYELEVPASFDPQIAERYSRVAPRLELIEPTDSDAINRAVARADLVFQWQLEGSSSAVWRQRLAGRTQRFRVDKHRVRLEGSFYIEAGFRNEDDRHQLDARNQAAFQALSQRLGSFERAYVFGTGPSADLYSDFDFEGGLSIVCNTIIKDHDLMDHVRPQILCFADPIFHFGCSRYAARFRDEVRQAAQRHDFTICIPRKYFTLFVDLLPELEARTIGIPIRKDRSINLDLAKAFELKSVDNVLTFLLLPIASTLAREIHVIGCDGRPLEEDQYFWQHNPKTQLTELMDNIQEVHPGFFDLDYNDYYLQHCENTEQWMQAGEKIGRRYISMVDSLVPALRRRGPTARALEGALDSTRGELRVVSINPDLVSSFGHYLHHDLRSRAEIESRQGKFVSLANLGVHGIADTGIVPWFTSHSWAARRNEIADQFGQEMSAALAAFEKVDLNTFTVFTMYLADPCHLVPLLAALAEHRPKRAVFVLNLFYAHFVIFGDQRHRLKEMKACLQSTRKLRRELGVHLCGDSSTLCNALSELSGEPFRLWPMFSVTDYCKQELEAAASRDRTSGPLAAYYPSNLQISKGYDLLAEAVEKMNRRERATGLRFVVRELYRPTTPPSLRDYADQLRPWAEMVEGILSPSEYSRRMVESDIILAPYRIAAFKARTSGVISDAMLLGKPVVTTAGTWCGEQVERFGAGATFRDGDVDSFIDALSEVRNNYPRYLEQAQQARESWLREHSPTAFANMVYEVANEPFERVSEQRKSLLLAEIGTLRRALGRKRWRFTLRQRLRRLEQRHVLGRTLARGERFARRMLWRTRRWINHRAALGQHGSQRRGA